MTETGLPTQGTTPFEKGMDFLLHFRGKRFSLYDIMDRYQISYRQASRLRKQADRVIGLKPAGFTRKDSGSSNKDAFLWEMTT